MVLAKAARVTGLGRADHFDDVATDSGCNFFELFNRRYILRHIQSHSFPLGVQCLSL
jgi:hypothetical protein